MFKVTEQIVNTTTSPLVVWFEPWGMPHTLQPGDSFTVVAESDQCGRLEIDLNPSAAAVYGWPGSTLQVYQDDKLVDSFDIKFPDLPPGMSAKSFIDFMFGGPGGPTS